MVHERGLVRTDIVLLHRTSLGPRRRRVLWLGASRHFKRVTVLPFSLLYFHYRPSARKLAFVCLHIASIQQNLA